MFELLVVLGALGAFIVSYGAYAVPSRIKLSEPEKKEPEVDNVKHEWVRTHNINMLKHQEPAEDLEMLVRSIVLDPPADTPKELPKEDFPTKRVSPISWQAWIQNNRELDQVRYLIR